MNDACKYCLYYIHTEFWISMAHHNGLLQILTTFAAPSFPLTGAATVRLRSKKTAPIAVRLEVVNRNGWWIVELVATGGPYMTLTMQLTHLLTYDITKHWVSINHLMITHRQNESEWLVDTQ